MLKALLLLSLLIILNGPECDPKKQDERITALEASVNQLRAAVAELNQKPKTEHHYDMALRFRHRRSLHSANLRF
jgi:hypothetical protein